MRRSNPEAVKRMLERMHDRGDFPPRPVIRRFEVWADVDSTGDPAYFVWVLVDDDTADEDPTLEAVRPIRQRIFDAVFQGPDERWPYIRTMTESEFAGATPA